ncbi:type IV pili methyl-accepting chemotaxis transducer N-terminal domain-containing protein [Streptomyces sp. NPDC101733]|uniref:type IV pili methyl-accepting chemotaxis transducer N-terminal domain-containing protein n=1 Tax=unclassified Streptomyces TaxID=2593676 RepID=UPI0037F95689
MATTLICATAALGLSACSDSSDETPKEEATKAAAALCNDLATLKADSAKLRAMDPANSTKDQIKSAFDAVQTDWDNVKKNAQALEQAKRDAVKNSAEGLKKSYEDLPGDTTGQQVMTSIQPELAKLDASVAAASTSLKC